MSSLSDTGAGEFGPGWDISTDVTNGYLHLAAYGLGSPFPEDVKLCAAFSAFWPAVAPDTARSAFGFRSVAPMTDRETGLEDAPAWDGIKGPRLVHKGDSDYVVTDNFHHVDYVKQTLNNKFTMVETMKVDQEAYQARVLATARMYEFIGSIELQTEFRMLSFIVGQSDDLLKTEFEKLSVAYEEPIYRYKMVKIGGVDGKVDILKADKDNATPWLRQEKILKTYDIIVTPTGAIVYRENGGEWQPRPSSLV